MSQIDSMALHIKLGKEEEGYRYTHMKPCRYRKGTSTRGREVEEKGKKKGKL